MTDRKILSGYPAADNMADAAVRATDMMTVSLLAQTQAAMAMDDRTLAAALYDLLCEIIDDISHEQAIHLAGVSSQLMLRNTRGDVQDLLGAHFGAKH